MIDFIFAGALFIGVMFVVCFVLSFVTIGITYSLARFTKNFINRLKGPHPVLK